jgi:predicted DsbA family dithiol-disulfide isomerase
MRTQVTRDDEEQMTVIEVFADVGCPFTHVGLRRFVDRRTAAGRHDLVLRVRTWPLEIINGEPLDAHFIAEEVDDIRRQVAPTLFAHFSESAFPSTFLPALTLAAAAYDQDLQSGEDVSLELRDLLFEQGVDVGSPDVLRRVAEDHHVEVDLDDTSRVLREHADGVARGVVGSPHFFTPEGGFFCPALDVHRDEQGHLQLTPDTDNFDRFIAGCFG